MGDESRTEFGPLLRQAREKRGVSLQQVAATTKISARVLDALERNDPSKLPGGIFSRAFVRAYAKEVGLDPEETVKRFVAAFPPDLEEAAPQAPGKTVDAEGFESQRRTAMTLFQILGLSVLVVVVAAVYVNMRPTPAVPPTLPESSESAIPSTPVVPVPSEASTSPGAVEAGTLPRSPGGPAVAADTPPAQTAIPPAGGATGPPQAIPPDAPLVVSIVADAECWLSLSVDGTRVVARNLQPGERVAHSARDVVILSAGNAGALTMTINGKPARPLGGRGQVVTATITVGTLSNFLQ